MFDCENIIENDKPIVIFHHGMKILGPIYHKEATELMRKKLAKKNYSTVLYYRRSPEVEDDCDDFHECICNEPWKSRKLILVGHSSGACYIRYLRTHARGLHFLKSVALDGSFLYETIEYFFAHSHPPDEIQTRRPLFQGEIIAETGAEHRRLHGHGRERALALVFQYVPHEETPFASRVGMVW
jgi:hypothetical protein